MINLDFGIFDYCYFVIFIESKIIAKKYSNPKSFLEN